MDVIGNVNLKTSDLIAHPLLLMESVPRYVGSIQMAPLTFTITHVTMVITTMEMDVMNFVKLSMDMNA